MQGPVAIVLAAVLMVRTQSKLVRMRARRARVAGGLGRMLLLILLLVVVLAATMVLLTQSRPLKTRAQ